MTKETDNILYHDDLFKENIGKLILLIPNVKSEINILQIELDLFIKENKVDLPGLIQEGCNLLVETVSFGNECEQFQHDIESETNNDIFETVQSYYECAKSLMKQNFCLKLLNNTYNYSCDLSNYQTAIENNQLKLAIQCLLDVKNPLDQTTNELNDLHSYAAIKTFSDSYWDSALEKLDYEWNKFVITQHDEKANCEIIKLILKFEESVQTEDLLGALHLANKLEEKIEQFGKCILENVLFPAILYDISIIEESIDTIVITIQSKNRHKPLYNVALENLKTLFTFLHSKFKYNFDIENEKSVISLLGQHISVDFADVLIKECLMETIPSLLSDLQNYGKITSEIEEFQKFLANIGFFPKENFSILQYANNVDFLFAEKSCQYFLESARAIMFKDLSSSISIGVEFLPSEEELHTVTTGKEAETINIVNGEMPKSLYFFPRCMISKSTQELLDLLFVMMEQAAEGSDLCCERLYLTARLVFELYDTVVPLHHEKFLQTIPQYVALFHNNCMYLSHNCLTLGEKWLQSIGTRNLTFVITFLDLVPKMRMLGQKHLSTHMQLQRNQIFNNIRSSDLQYVGFKDTLDDSAEQAVRQCLRQIQLLTNVWVGLFPKNIFQKLLSCLINMFIQEIIHRVSTVEDISAKLATQLSEICSIVVKKIPTFFEENELKSWSKLNQLIFVLNSSLKDIESRWSDGKGDLAQCFTVDEIRTLIKALFQNTQFRAALLSKIK